MLFFPPLQMRRFTVQLRELSIAQSLKLAAIPEHLDEMATTLFLRAAVESAPLDPAMWTVQERIMGVAHYLSATSGGNPDFDVGGSWHFTDYFMPEATPRKEASDWFDLAGDTWRVVPVLGRFAESLERLSGEIEGVQGKAHWNIGMVAAGLERKNEAMPSDLATDHEIDEWLLARMRVLIEFPESDFIGLMLAHNKAATEVAHLFKLRSDESGIIVMPSKEVAGIPPARFPVRATLSEFAQAMAGKPD